MDNTGLMTQKIMKSTQKGERGGSAFKSNLNNLLGGDGVGNILKES